MASLYELKNDAVQRQYDVLIEIQTLEKQIAEELEYSEGEVTVGIQALMDEKDIYLQSYDQIVRELHENERETIEWRCKVIRNEKAYQNILKEEIKFLQAKLKSSENKVEWQEEKMQDGMAYLGTTKDVFGAFKVSIGSRSSIEVDEDAALLPVREMIESGASMSEVIDTFPYVGYTLKLSKTEAKKMVELPLGFSSVDNKFVTIK